MKGCRLRRGEGRGARGRGGREWTPSPSQAGRTDGWKEGWMDGKDKRKRVKMKGSESQDCLDPHVATL